ncbi:hypothetical protein PY254_16015 [Rhodanobacter sp. AS-Z3]|uniref:hypothetical protein n=1 Tax=Rhodanobacter sp. AS-Z3 TaxID=3031330 RepID=UPI00247A5618|nr:hypothetical protein [Rhodanobacter sp. AS-Z3]WEN14718.1 hypothetical protein PY254_16015 [Rhodanobacter sp. AS-Z3]
MSLEAGIMAGMLFSRLKRQMRVAKFFVVAQSDRLPTSHKTYARNEHKLVTTPRSRLIVAAMALLCTTAAGAATIKTIVANSPLLCRQFLTMVKVAGVPKMGDKQLCDFRFERLLSSKTKHFTTIDWKPLEVKDPLAMYRHMRMANVQGPPANDGPPWPDLMNAVAEAAADHDVGFYTTQVQLQGKGPKVTVVEMDVLRNCSNLPRFMRHVGVPYFAMYKDVGLQHRLRFWIPHERSQMMLWNHNGLQMPVLLGIQPYWGAPIGGGLPHSYLNVVTLDTLVPDNMPAGEFHDTVSNYGVCAYDLWSKIKPIGAEPP